ncbi:MAG: M50 family metallopeptidase [Candidatus Polarisedimenticolia bacterium]
MKLFRLAGIDVYVHGSWFIIFFLLVWSFSCGFFPLLYPGLAPGVCLTLGIVTTLLFFGSVLIHELSHSVVAVADGMEVQGITLFIFGGVSQMRGDSLSPRSELRIAAAGPLASFVLGILFAGASWLAGRPEVNPWNGMMVHLALMNISLGVFNLLPGFPLDGGRLVRALLWRRHGDRLRATMTAAQLGRGMAWCLILLGLWLTARGYLIQGVWIAFIGLYLDRAAASERRDAVISSRLAGFRVETVMTPGAVTMPAGVTAAEALMSFRRDGFSGYPVVQDDRVVGVISLDQIESCPTSRRGTTPVRDLMTPLTPDQMATPDESLLSAVGKMTMQGLSRLPVLGRAGGGLAGLLTRHAVAQRLRLAGLASGQGT